MEPESLAYVFSLARLYRSDRLAAFCADLMRAEEGWREANYWRDLPLDEQSRLLAELNLVLGR